MFRKLITVSHFISASAKSNVKLTPKYCSATLSTLKMSSASMECIPKVDIDPSGVFKYILIKVHDPAQDDDDCSLTIVRGYSSCNYHSDIYDLVEPQLKPFDAEPLGGGRISHEPDCKKIHIYGYSQGYGKADHEVTASLIKEAYPDYKVTISDEGY